MKDRDNIKELFDKIELQSPSNDFHSRLMSECSKKVRKESIKELRIERAQNILATAAAFVILSWGIYMTFPKNHITSICNSFMQMTMPDISIPNISMPDISMPDISIPKYQPETWGFAILLVVLMAMIALCACMTNNMEISKLDKQLKGK